MHAKQLAIGTLAGVVTVLATGFLIFTAALSYGALLTLVIGTRAYVTIGAGLKIGAIVSFLLWCTADFMLYGISNVGNLTTTVVDPFLELVPGAIA